jgi:hypothetical protein
MVKACDKRAELLGGFSSGFFYMFLSLRMEFNLTKRGFTTKLAGFNIFQVSNPQNAISGLQSRDSETDLYR